MTPKLPVRVFRLKNRKKYGLILATLLNLAFGLFFLWLGTQIPLRVGKFLLALLSVSSFLFFAFTLYGLIVLTRDGFAGMFISSQGINDISTGHSYGVVQWKSVTKMNVVTDLQYPDRKYIILKVANPQLYISRERSLAKRRSMMTRYHYYGSPVVFSERGLDCTFEELETTVRSYYENYRTRKAERENAK